MGARASRSNVETRVQAVVHGLTATVTRVLRTPIVRTPETLKLGYQEITFASTDGVRLEGWYIPGRSDRLVVCTHPAHGNRYGLPAHLKDYVYLGGRELSFLPLYRALHDAGYGVLCFDLRNHGKSGGDEDGNQRYGLFEHRDVLGALRYLRERHDTQHMKVTLLGAGLGANASLIAAAREDVRALIALQPGSTRPLIERIAKRTELVHRIELFEQAIHARTWHTLDALSPLPSASALRVPTLTVQQRCDWQPQLRDAQALHDALATPQKELLWADGETRLDVLAALTARPAPLLGWLGGLPPRATSQERHLEAAGSQQG